MKIAYLISAHNDPEHLKRLICALNIKNCTDFYIHIDKKVNIFPFKEKLELLKDELSSEIKICEERINVNWGGFSQVKYQTVLIDAVINSPKVYDRIFFLSGADYPLFSNRKIIETLERNPSKQFICGMDLTNNPSGRKIFEITDYHLFWDLNIRKSVFKRGLIWISRVIFHNLPIKKKPYLIIDKQKWHIFKGSSWWCLTYPCLKEVNKYLHDKRIIHYFNYSHTPDEKVIQTIVFNTQFNNGAIYWKGEYPGLPKLTPLHQIDYTDAIKVYQLNDANSLLNSGKMFFRKATTSKSSELLDYIDKERNKNNS